MPQQRIRKFDAKKSILPLALAVLLGVTYIATSNAMHTVPSRVDFSRMSQPRTPADEVPAWYKGERPPMLGLDSSRFLGNVGEKAVYLSQHNSDYCLTLVQNSTGLGGGCGTAEQIATKGLVLNTSDESGVDICVIALPDQYPNVRVPFGVRVLTQNDQMIAVLTPSESRTITLTGKGLKPLSIDIVALP